MSTQQKIEVHGLSVNPEMVEPLQAVLASKGQLNMARTAQRFGIPRSSLRTLVQRCYKAGLLQRDDAQCKAVIGHHLKLGTDHYFATNLDLEMQGFGINGVNEALRGDRAEYAGYEWRRATLAEVEANSKEANQ